MIILDKQKTSNIKYYGKKKKLVLDQKWVVNSLIKGHLSTKTTLKSSHQEMIYKWPLDRDHLWIKAI